MIADPNFDPGIFLLLVNSLNEMLKTAASYVTNNWAHLRIYVSAVRVSYARTSFRHGTNINTRVDTIRSKGKLRDADESLIKYVEDRRDILITRLECDKQRTVTHSLRGSSSSANRDV